MSSYQELMSQIETLKRQAEDARKQETSGAIAEIKRIMAEYGLSGEDIGYGGRPTKVKRAGSGIVKYRDPVSGMGWSGRGRRPGWVRDLEGQGKTIEDCRVA
jgi:DNA-binding protein H-NS